jgi:2-dehydro-3-deoxyglucarate aldolase/4-hydroxy-2-oxoheptanedioate aldolase
MKPNRLKQVQSEGRIPIGHMVLEFGTRGVAQMLEVAGLDFVVIDMEHTGFSAANVADLIAWFKATTVAPFVRVPQLLHHFVARSLDAGALGIMVPNVVSGAQARALVDAAKYAPLGKRGVILGEAHTHFKSVDPSEFMAFSNQNTTLICQIESREGLDNLDEIAATPGVDVLWIGHFDLTQSLGIPGQFHNQLFLDAAKRVIETARKHGLGAGIQPNSLAQAQEWIELGFDVISYSGDLYVYLDAMTRAVADVRRVAGEQNAEGSRQ